MQNLKTIGILGINEYCLIFLDYCKKYHYQTIIFNNKLASSFNEKCDKLIIGSFSDSKAVNNFFETCDLVYLASKKITFSCSKNNLKKIISFDKDIDYYQKNPLLQQEFFSNIKFDVLPFSNLKDKNSLLTFKEYFSFPLVLKSKNLLFLDNYQNNLFILKNKEQLLQLSLYNFFNFFAQQESDSLLFSLTFKKKSTKIISYFWSVTTFYHNLMVKTEPLSDSLLQKEILKILKKSLNFLKENIFYTVSFKKFANKLVIVDLSCFLEKYSFWALKSNFNCFELLLNSEIKNISSQNNLICYFVTGKYYYQLFDFLLKNPEIYVKDYLKDDFEASEIVAHFLVLKTDKQAILNIEKFLQLK